jgi:hypothetical protein
MTTSARGPFVRTAEEKRLESAAGEGVTNRRIARVTIIPSERRSVGESRRRRDA